MVVVLRVEVGKEQNSYRDRYGSYTSDKSTPSTSGISHRRRREIWEYDTEQKDTSARQENRVARNEFRSAGTQRDTSLQIDSIGDIRTRLRLFIDMR